MNESNNRFKTPFHIAIDKNNRQMKLKLLKLLKLENLSPLTSFRIRDSPLKLGLRQEDIDSAYELAQNDQFVSEFLDEMQNEPKSEEIVIKLLIGGFKMFVNGYNKGATIADLIITVFGGNVTQFRKGKNPILDSGNIGRFECIQYVIDNNLIERWDHLVDKENKNIFHYLSEHNEYDIVKRLVRHINQQDSSNEGLYNLLYQRGTVDGQPPRLYADPHRAIGKYLTYLEKLVSRKYILQRRNNIYKNNINEMNENSQR